jgi:uncharacterized protein (TIGR03435 family)
MRPLLTLALLASCAVINAQSPAGSPSFDVAAVKPVRSENRLQKPMSCAFGAGGKFVGYGFLRYLIACAYGIRSADPRQQIVGGPNWIDVDFFDIMANPPQDINRRLSSEQLLMVRSLLAERFQLVVHRETRDVPMYRLMVSRRDGKLGPQLRPATTDCAAYVAAGRRGSPPPVTGDLPCGRQVVSRGTFRSAAMSMTQLVNLLSPSVERPVQDQTGLTGTFAVDLQWRPENQPDAGVAARLPDSVFTALEEQLGLKLESTRGPLDVLVIDRVEHPTPD